jgi:hypothetical protein
MKFKHIYEPNQSIDERSKGQGYYENKVGFFRKTEH